MLRNHVVKRDVVKINRAFHGRDEHLAAIILEFNRDFVLVQVVDDFCLDGYTILRKDQFDGVRCNKFDKAQKKILKAEGILDKVYGFDKAIDLGSWQTIFTDLKKLDYHVIVECEDAIEPEFMIGPIRQVTKSKVGILYYDPAGKLDKQVSQVDYERITTVKFGDRYSTIFRKYLQH